jgi:predicted SprT family Zn-dependent metalloprotease
MPLKPVRTPQQLIDLAREIGEEVNRTTFGYQINYSLHYDPKPQGRMKQAYGYASGSRVYLTPIMCQSLEHEIRETMTHELIHVAQHQFDMPVDHGVSFRSIAAKFNIQLQTEAATVKVNQGEDVLMVDRCATGRTASFDDMNRRRA